MDWLNLHTKELDSPEVIGAEPTDRGTWLMLLRYCIGQENGGRLEGCAAWKDRKWQQLVRVTLAEVRRNSELWTWVDADLVVTYYPIEKQLEVQHLRAIGKLKTPAKQAAAKANGTLGGRPTGNPTENPTGNPTETQLEPNKKPIEGKGREGKGKEGNGREAEEAARAAQIELIRVTYPRRTHVRETLEAISAACARAGGPDAVLVGTHAVAVAVGSWTESEKLQFLKTPPAFFHGDHWRDDPAFWASKTAARKEHAGVRPDVPLDLGGRKPKAIRAVPVGAGVNGDDSMLKF